MKVFWKAFLGGAVCAILVFIFVPFFAGGMSPSIAIAKMTNSPLKIISLIETIGISGVIFWLCVQFICLDWAQKA